MKNFAFLKKSSLPLVIGIILIPFFSSAQKASLPVTKAKLFHIEKPRDMYLPNAFENEKVSPGYKFNNTNSRKSSLGSTIFTNQVNVNTNGQNILGDAANEPSIAINPTNINKIAVGWRQFDNVLSNFRQAGWGYSADSGKNWTFPGVIEPGIFRSDPVLDYDNNGNFYYNSLTNSPSFQCKVFKSTNGGMTWDAGVDAAGGDKQWMVIDRTSGPGSGNIYSFWSSFYSVCPGLNFTRSSTQGNSFESCTFVNGDPALGTMSIGSNGELYIAGYGNGFDSLIVCKSSNVNIPGSTILWNDSVPVYMDGFIGFGGINPDGIVGQVNIEAGKNNLLGQSNVYLLASLVRNSILDPSDVIFSKSNDGGLTFSAPIRINDDLSEINNQWLGTISVAPNGRIDVVWLDTRDDITGMDLSALYYSYSINQGNTWSVNEKLSDSFDPHVGYPNQNKMGDYFDMESDNIGAHLAWANTLNGEQDVYYSYIIPPAPTSINELLNGLKFTVYPNPSNGKFTILSDEKKSDVEIFTLLGDKIYAVGGYTINNEIDISTQPAGVYFLKIKNQKGKTGVKKIIKN